MVRVVRVDADGTELATIELDDFTVEILYSGIATMLHQAAEVPTPQLPAAELSRPARERRARILTRIAREV
jgi:hypothetical protein